MRGSLSGDFVRKTGDTMTGDLTIVKVTPAIFLRGTGGGEQGRVNFGTDASIRQILFAPAPGDTIRTYDGVAGLDRFSFQRGTGGMDLGLVPLARMRITDASAANGGAVTVTSAYTNIISLPSMTLAVGDVILVFAQARLDKGVTGGTTYFRIDQTAGTGVGGFYGVGSPVDVSQNVLASTGMFLFAGGIWVCTTAGTVTLTARGLSQGTDSTVVVGAGLIRGYQLQGA